MYPSKRRGSTRVQVVGNKQKKPVFLNTHTNICRQRSKHYKGNSRPKSSIGLVNVNFLRLLGSSLLLWRGGLLGCWLGVSLCNATRLGDSLDLGLADDGRSGRRRLARLGRVGLGLSGGLLGSGGLLSSRPSDGLLGGGGLLCGGSLGGSSGLLE